MPNKSANLCNDNFGDGIPSRSYPIPKNICTPSKEEKEDLRVIGKTDRIDGNYFESNLPSSDGIYIKVPP
jgi:hypothetical protein